MAGRTIKIYLVDGTSSGLRTAELGLSTIKAVVVPRISLTTSKNRQEIQKTGVYILIGTDPDKPGMQKIYIGEGDTVITRLNAHNNDPAKDFWDQAVVFVSKDENLTKAHGRYLEAKLVQLALAAKRCSIVNGTEPSEIGKLPEPDEDEMDQFIDQAKLLLGTLGYNIFEPTPPAPQIEAIVDESRIVPVFKYSGDGFHAMCHVDLKSSQFIVKKDATARKRETDSLVQSYKNLRMQLIDNEVLIEYDENSYVFTQDYSFNSITAAAQVVSGQTISGRVAWKAENTNLTFAEWEESEMQSS